MMNRTRPVGLANVLVAALALVPSGACWAAAPQDKSPAGAAVVFPLGRTAYFLGERVLVSVRGSARADKLKLDGVHTDGRVPLYAGRPGAVLIDTARLAAGDYALQIDGAPAGATLTLADTLRKSPGSLQDECLPADRPQMSREERADPALAARKTDEYRQQVVRTLKETGLTAAISMAVTEMPRRELLDALAQAGTLLLVNPDTRPTSFFPTSVDPAEIDGMSQRMILTAQANGRYPNFGGFCFGWDATGHALGGRKGLMTYWGWGDQTQALRNYIGRVDECKTTEFTRRTGLAPVTQDQYVTYLLSIGRADFAPAIDLPTKLWLQEMAQYMKPLPPDRRAQFEKRLDAWSGYLMGLYDESYSKYAAALRELDPTLCNTSSVNLDHCPVIYGQYLPSACRPLDFLYMSAWNDQVSGPDYLYQWLLTAGMLNMHRGGRPVWVSHSLGAVHGQSAVPGKFVRAIAHNLAHGGSGAGFAHEGFSNLLGGMNAQSRWESIRGTAAGWAVLAGRDFLDRFAALALDGRGDHGVGILFSRSQFARQCITMGFGVPQYKAFIVLTRLGYTPRFVTEEEIASSGLRDVKALVVVCQTVPLPPAVTAGLEAFAKAGGRIVTDGSTSVPLPQAKRMDLAIPFTVPGKPHSWSSPNLAKGQNDVILYEQWHPQLARAFAKALDDTGRGLLRSDAGPDAKVTLMQIDGGPDATYVVAVNDSHVRTHCDWHQVAERLVPGKGVPPGAAMYDCTAEKPLGRPGEFDCDLTGTTARVYAVLPREIRAVALKAGQSARLGECINMSAEFHDAAGKRIQAVVPFHLAVVRPDGKTHLELYRATDRQGRWEMSLPLPACGPQGQWTVALRCQLSGEEALLPVTVEAARPAAFAAAVDDPVFVRQADAIPKGPSVRKLLTQGSKLVLPLFDTPHLADLLPVARKLQADLAAKGVDVEIRPKPRMSTYWLAYDPTAEQLAENALADAAQAVGRIKRTTVNHNDWYSGMSGYRFGRAVILLDLAGRKDNEMAEALDRCGMLWPEMSEAFPGPGRAVVQLVHWAFSPQTPAVVVQAWDVQGLLAGARALADPPPDRLTEGIREARAALFRQYHVGGRPAPPADLGQLTARGLRVRSAPQPFVMRFDGAQPPAADQVQPPAPYVHPAQAVPGALSPEQFAPCMLVDGRYVEATSPGGKWPRDLRFSQALRIVVDVRRPGRTRIAAEGTYRYSDRRPRSQAQWEDLLAIRDKVVPKRRLPMAVEVRLGDKVLGTLVPTRTASREVPVETLPFYAKQKPRSVVEEVVTELAGEADLPPARQELLLVHRNIVDGQLDRLDFTAAPAPAPKTDRK